MLRKVLLVALCCAPVFALCQGKVLPAVKTSQAPKIDGNLDDAAWQQAPVAADFVQNFPSYGGPVAGKTEVRLLYDDEAIYVGAYLYDNPALMRRQITSRDGEQRQDVDYFSVFFDTYNDQQNGFQFLVTPANVQTDAKLNPTANVGFGEFGDKSWDAVWQSQVQVKSDGWVVEMRIPYLSLRFSKKDVQTWGLQFLRYVRRTNENDYWSPVDPKVNGFINQFGKYADIKDIKPPLRLSFSPYLSGGVRVNPSGSDIKTQWLRNGGMDVKYGINESFTLDATLIPDFGQVVSDNVVNNLSPFEVQFNENRPFFTEGTELFNKAGLFYSRRIGATPNGYNSVNNFVHSNNDYELVRNPSVVQLYNGIKFSGRTKKKLGIGVFNALTAPMQARLTNITSGNDSLVRTEPLTNYNIIVLDQSLKGRSSVTFTNTNVNREGSARDANVSSLDWSLYTANSRYRLNGKAAYSKIFGYSPFPGGINLIYDTVTKGGRLMVKPYDGYNTQLRLGKVSGHLQYYANGSIMEHTYDPTDLGYLQSPNKVEYGAGISYNQLTANDRFVTSRYSLDVNTFYLYKPYRFSEVYLEGSAFWVFKNFWDVTLTANAYPTVQNDFFDLRTPGKYFERPAEYGFGVNGSTDSRKRWFFSYSGSVSLRNAADNSYNVFDLGLRYRFSDRFTLSTDFFRQFENNQRGWSFMRESNGDPILGFRDNTDIQAVLSGVYNFTPRVNLTMRARHYWNKVHYNSFYAVGDEAALTPRTYINNTDDNYNVFNLDAFLTWDFRLGSRLIVGWKNWLGDYYAVDGVAHRQYFRNLGETFAASHGNELTVKLIYFLDYNQLKKKY